MLSTHPSTLVITCIDELGKEFSLPSSVVPRVGEQVISPKDEVFFVKNVIYAQRIIILELSSKEVVAETRIIPDNNPMPEAPPVTITVFPLNSFFMIFTPFRFYSITLTSRFQCAILLKNSTILLFEGEP